MKFCPETLHCLAILPLDAFSPIFPYRSYIGTFADVVEGPGADTGRSNRYEIGTGIIALLLAVTAGQGHRYPQKPPQPSLWEDKSTVLRATQRPTTARKGGTHGEEV
jgi:hypothetical protein